MTRICRESIIIYFTIGTAVASDMPSHIENAKPSAYKIVVHAENSLDTLPLETVRQYFLKKKTNWPSGQRVLPVDLHETSSLRELFSQQILQRKVRSVRAYWQKNIFSGRAVPPPEKKSDADVMSYIREHKNAIGYVSSNCVLSAELKVVQVDPHEKKLDF